MSAIWESIPKHLSRENKKFIFSAVEKSARARDYEDAIVWLEKAGLIHRVFAVETARLPLKGYADRRCFKVYALDVGLLGALAGTAPQLAVQGDRLFAEYRGALVENFVAQQLAATFRGDLHYWRSAGGKAEVDFLIEQKGVVLPLEVKAGVNPKSKSLQSFDAQFSPPARQAISLNSTHALLRPPGTARPFRRPAHHYRPQDRDKHRKCQFSRVGPEFPNTLFPAIGRRRPTIRSVLLGVLCVLARDLLLGCRPPISMNRTASSSGKRRDCRDSLTLSAFTGQFANQVEQVTNAVLFAGRNAWLGVWYGRSETGR